MPVPGGKATGNASAFGSHSKTNRQESNLEQVDDFEEWREGVDTLCRLFKIPDLSSRRGLKRIHAHLDDIYARMDSLYERDERVQTRAAIVAIFSKLCLDSILRTKLFEKGILSMIIPLLDADETRHLAFRVLSIMTHHSGEAVQVEIARYANKLSRIIRDLPDDERLASLGVATLCHSVSPLVMDLLWPPNWPIWQSLDIVDVFKTILESVKRADFYSPTIISHTMALLSAASGPLSSSLKAHPSTISFLSAGMRSKNWLYRCICLASLMDLNKANAKEDLPLPEQPRYISAVLKEMPGHLQVICMNYAPGDCENYLNITCQSKCVEAMLAYAQNLDLYALGVKLVELILTSEFPISKGATYYGEEFSPTTLAGLNYRLPFTQWVDGLPLCAKAVRVKGIPGEEDLADILDLAYLVESNCLTQAIKLAKRCLKRNPEQPYFHYVLSLSSNNLEALGPVKKALKCKTIPPFMRYQLLQRAVECAGQMGLRVWKGNLEEAVALFTSALADAKLFIAEAPPDSRHMRNVCCWYVLLTVLFNPDISPDLRELHDILYKLDIADHFSKYIGHAPSKSHLRLTQKALVKHYHLGVAEFGPSFAKAEKLNSNFGFALPLRSEEDLTEWLEEMRREDGTAEPVINCGSNSSKANPKLDHERISMYCCSWCENRSAAMRKCSRCSKTRYCDSECQRYHWKEHKKNCNM